MKGRVQMGTLKTGTFLCHVSLIIVASIRWSLVLPPSVAGDRSSSCEWRRRAPHKDRREAPGSCTSVFAISNIRVEWTRCPAEEDQACRMRRAIDKELGCPRLRTLRTHDPRNIFRG